MTHPKSRRNRRGDNGGEQLPLFTLLANAPSGQMAKPGELIDFRVKGDKLTRRDLEIENLLLRNALATRERFGMVGGVFNIRLAVLRGSHNGTDRIDASLERLQASLMQISHGDRNKLSVAKLGTWKRGEMNGVPDGMLEYTYPRDYVEVIHNSMFHGMLDLERMARLSSKYAYRLYEVASRRVKLRHVTSETFAPDYMRHDVLGVPAGKLSDSNSLLRRAIQPAVEQVNAIAPFQLDVVPLVEKRRTLGYCMSWTSAGDVVA